MKKILLICSIFLVSCSQVSQNVSYDQFNGYCVTTYINGLWNHCYNDFNISEYCGPDQVDSVKKEQMLMAEEYLKIANK